MGQDLEFVSIPRQKAVYRPAAERVKDFRDVAVARNEQDARRQALRCTDCFSAFCHWACPIGNVVPDFNRYIAEGNWREAYGVLQAHNNFPEFTGRLCPAPCEASCVMTLAGWGAVTNRENELSIIERAFAEGLVTPRVPARRTGKRVAIIGSGPAGLACADQLNWAGHTVVVFERDRKPGGVLRYGIPDFKLEKRVLDRRIEMLERSGIQFRTGTNVGEEYPAARLLEEFHAVCVATGSRVPRDLPIEGRSLRGIHVAMDYLTQVNRWCAHEPVDGSMINAKGQRVVIIGGGDTGADCVGTALRQGAAAVLQIELLPQPPEQRQPDDLWPNWPNVLRTSTNHEEGGRREWAVQTKRFLGRRGLVRALSCVRVEWATPSVGAAPSFIEIAGSEFEIRADLVILALGFVGSGADRLLEALGVRRDERQHVAVDRSFQTSAPNVFAAGDVHRGPSLVAWAINEGRAAAHHIDQMLAGGSELPAV